MCMNAYLGLLVSALVELYGLEPTSAFKGSSRGSGYNVS